MDATMEILSHEELEKVKGGYWVIINGHLVWVEGLPPDDEDS